MSDDQPNQMRRATKIIGGVSVVGALWVYTQFAERFVTREEGVSIVENQKEATRKMERGFDKVVDRIKEAEARLTANQQSAEARQNEQRNEIVHRIETLEQAKILEAASRNKSSRSTN